MHKQGDHIYLPAGSRFAARTRDERAASLRPRPAVFLDRDGVLVEDVGYLSRSADMRILPRVAQALRALRDRFYLVVVTNQSGIARGLLTEQDLRAIHAELVGRLAGQGALLDAIYYCPHLPEGAVGAYRMRCECRKPAPGMLRQAIADWDIDVQRSFMVGDRMRDIEAGRAVGAQGILLAQETTGETGMHWPAPDLLEAARLILRKDLL